MKKMGLFYFSGTNNTKKIAILIQNYMETINWEVHTYAVENYTKSQKEVDISDFDMIGIGSPIYGFGLPSIVTTFVKLIKKHPQNAFIFLTAAENNTINYNAPKSLVKQLKKKEINCFYERIFPMGCNWLIPYSDELINKLVEVAKTTVPKMCKELIINKENLLIPNLFTRFIMPIVYWGEKNIFARLFGKSLKVNESCNLCRKCINNCPKGNISISKNKIKFSWRCISCMKCVYACDKKAIYSKGFNFVILKEGYDLEKSIKKAKYKPFENTKDQLGKIL